MSGEVKSTYPKNVQESELEFKVFNVGNSRFDDSVRVLKKSEDEVENGLELIKLIGKDGTSIKLARPIVELLRGLVIIETLPASYSQRNDIKHVYLAFEDGRVDEVLGCEGEGFRALEPELQDELAVQIWDSVPVKQR